MLTKGYLSGRLTFNYPTSLSRLREQYILNEIEKEELAELLHAKLIVSAGAVAINPQNLNVANGQLENLLELKLPYIPKPDKIAIGGSLPPLDDEEKKYWSELIKQRRSAKNDGNSS